MIKPHFIVLCEQAFLSAGSNNLNLIGMFTQINADKFPFTYPRFALVVNFDAAVAGQHVLRTVLTDPAGTAIANTDLPVAVMPGNMQVIANFENMRFGLPGQYTFTAHLDGQLIGQRSLQVRPVLPPKSVKPNIA